MRLRVRKRWESEQAISRKLGDATHLHDAPLRRELEESRGEANGLEGYEPRCIGCADEINRQMPTYVLQLVTDALNDRGRAVRGSRILVLGAAYKPNVADPRDSPALEIIDTLLTKGAAVAYHDPLVPDLTVNGVELRSVDWPDAQLHSRDLVLVLTAHATYDWAALVRDSPLLIDTRNATGHLGLVPNVIRL